MSPFFVCYHLCYAERQGSIDCTTLSAHPKHVLSNPNQPQYKATCKDHDELQGALPRLVSLFGLDPGEQEGDEVPGAFLPSAVVPEYTLLGDLLRLIFHDRVLLIDDGHWCDKDSWRTFHDLIRNKGCLMLVVAARTFVARGYAKPLLTLPQTTSIELKGLSNKDVTRLVCHMLKVDAVPLELQDVLHRRGQGNPRFCELLISHLVQQGQISTCIGALPAISRASLQRAENGPIGDWNNNKARLSFQGDVRSRISVSFDPSCEQGPRPRAPQHLPSAIRAKSGQGGLEKTIESIARRRSSTPWQAQPQIYSKGKAHAVQLRRFCRVQSLGALARMVLPEAVRDLLLHNFDQLSRGTLDRVSGS